MLDFLACHVTVKAPCRPCNNGWMSELEGATMPILGPLMHDAVKHVSEEDAAGACARGWVLKTAAMFQFNDPATRVFDDAMLGAIRREARAAPASREDMDDAGSYSR